MHDIIRTLSPRRAWRLLAVLVALVGSGMLAAHPERSAAQPAVPQAQSSQHSVYLPLIAVSGGAPTSDELIAAALKRGEIDQQTALLYHVFASFRDPRLPPQYRGARSSGTSRAYDTAARALSRLTPQAQAALRGFAVPPSAAGSWEEQQFAAVSIQAAAPRWATTCQTSANIKVWYHPYYESDAAAARSICELVDGTIWPQLVSFMGHGPLPDDTMPNTGGDARFDIYLVDASSEVAYPLDHCKQTPSYMLVNRNGYTRSQLAELLMRAILLGHGMADCGEYDWLFWATTNWAMDFVFKGDNQEHKLAPAYLNATERPLNSGAAEDDVFVALPPSFRDGAYLWPFHLARALKKPELIRAMWDNSSNPNSLAAVNDALPGGFQQAWPRFASLNWNREPVDTYQTEDELADGAKPQISEEVRLAGVPSRRYTLPAKVQYLAAKYYHFSFPDESVRSVLFTNPFAPELGGGSPYVHVEAFYHTDQNTLFTETWTGKHFVPFCRDLLKERVTELTIIVSNSDWEGKKTLEPFEPMTLDASNMACRGWQVEAELTNTKKGANVDQTSVVKTQATYDLYREGDQRYNIEQYKLTSGTASWTHSGRWWSCAGSGSGSYAVADPSLPTMMTVEAYNVSYMPPYSEGSRKYRALGIRARHAQPTTVTYSCPPGSTRPETIDMAIDYWLQTERAVSPEQWQSANADGHMLQGSFVYTTPSEGGAATMEYRYTWKMTALPPE
jgi:hypothetical protein